MPWLATIVLCSLFAVRFCQAHYSASAWSNCTRPLTVEQPNFAARLTHVISLCSSLISSIPSGVCIGGRSFRLTMVVVYSGEN
jgi:hypothetical protein